MTTGVGAVFLIRFAPAADAVGGKSPFPEVEGGCFSEGKGISSVSPLSPPLKLLRSVKGGGLW